MKVYELNALPSGRVIERMLIGRAKGKLVIVQPLSKTHCDDCLAPFPIGEKVIRLVAANRVKSTRCLSCFVEGNA